MAERTVTLRVGASAKQISAKQVRPVMKKPTLNTMLADFKVEVPEQQGAPDYASAALRVEASGLSFKTDAEALWDDLPLWKKAEDCCFFEDGCETTVAADAAKPDASVPAVRAAASRPRVSRTAAPQER